MSTLSIPIATVPREIPVVVLACVSSTLPADSNGSIRANPESQHLSTGLRAMANVPLNIRELKSYSVGRSPGLGENMISILRPTNSLYDHPEQGSAVPSAPGL